MHAAAPPVANAPAAQAVQVCTAVAPVAAEKNPGLQLAHVAAPVVLGW